MKSLSAFLLLLLGAWLSAQAGTTIDASNKFTYGANFGWMDWRGDAAHGANIGEYVCSGSIYSANVGWISLGSAAPANGIQYQNNSSNDFGVNLDGLGNLRGFAYGANIGWVNFESNGAPKVDLRTGRMTGSAYSANCGWISLSNAFAYVQTDTLTPGKMDTNGLPFAWELLNFGTTGVDPNADPDGDGMSNFQEYLAGTNPNDGSDSLRIIYYAVAPGGATTTLTWTSTLTRYYFVDKMFKNAWVDSGLSVIAPDGSSTTRVFDNDNAPAGFYRVRAVRPLQP